MKSARMEPMDEGILNERRPPRLFSRWSDDELVAYVERFMEENGISGRTELAKSDASLYYTLLKREKTNPALRNRICFVDKNRDWEAMDNEELISFARRIMENKGIKTKCGLRIADGGLYQALLKRERSNPGLLERCGFEEPQRDWDKVGDEGIIAFAKRLMQSHHISGRKELNDLDSGLYYALIRRERKRPGIMDKIGFEMKRHQMRDWRLMGDDELATFAKGFMAERGLRSKADLKRADNGLYGALRKRERKSPGIMDKIGFEEKVRDWESMSDEEMIKFSRRTFVVCKTRGEGVLRKTDRGLYEALRKRGLIGRVFSDIDSSQHKEAVDGVIDALDSFGDEG